MSSPPDVKEKVVYHAIPSMTCMTAVSSRMIHVRIFKNPADKTFAMSWAPVVAIHSVVESIYEVAVPDGQAAPKPGIDDAEMIKNGWTCVARNRTRVFPVIAHPKRGLEPVYGEDEFKPAPPARFGDTTVVCEWPPEEDEANAIRIAKRRLSRPDDFNRVIKLGSRELIHEEQARDEESASGAANLFAL